MWEHYKKSFKATQAVIFLVAVGTYVLLGRRVEQAATLFLFMQFTAVVGALWASRLASVTHRRSPGRQ